jgi:phenylpropionate dioxygenase-like ring-hydroxylating dioxygenase large terminal subunit
MKPGDARSSGISFQSILDRDGDNPPAFLREQSHPHMGDVDLDASRYTSREFQSQELDKMWTRVWQMACREEEIPEVGDNIVYEVGELGFIIARVGADDIRAYYNACLHRGTQLRPTNSIGHMDQFRCPFHGFTWGLDGDIKSIPCKWDFPHIDKEKFSLPQAKVGTWGGFVFINMDENCQPLEEYLSILPSHFERWPLEDRYMTANVRKVVRCNWKVAQEAFIEAFHVIETHPQALEFTGDANSQYDIWGDRISRLITTSGIASPHLDPQPSEQEIAEVLLYGAGTEARAEAAPLQEGQTARSLLSDSLKGAMKQQYGADLSHLSISEVIDAIEYFLFPNFFPWFNPSLPLIYRFLPYGDDPDMCTMDVMLLHPVPDEGPRPDPAPLRLLGPDEPFTEAPELNQISPVFEQDVSNMPRVQKGLKTLQRNKGVTLGNYQELRIRHFHQTLDKYLSDAIK